MGVRERTIDSLLQTGFRGRASVPALAAAPILAGMPAPLATRNEVQGCLAQVALEFRGDDFAPIQGVRDPHRVTCYTGLERDLGQGRRISLTPLRPTPATARSPSALWTNARALRPSPAVAVGTKLPAVGLRLAAPGVARMKRVALIPRA